MVAFDEIEAIPQALAEERDLEVEHVKAELGNVAPEYTGPLYPDIATELTVRTIPDIVEGGVPPAEALTAAVDTVAGD